MFDMWEAVPETHAEQLCEPGKSRWKAAAMVALVLAVEGLLVLAGSFFVRGAENAGGKTRIVLLSLTLSRTGGGFASIDIYTREQCGLKVLCWWCHHKTHPVYERPRSDALATAGYWRWLVIAQMPPGLLLASPVRGNEEEKNLAVAGLDLSRRLDRCSPRRESSPSLHRLGEDARKRLLAAVLPAEPLIQEEQAYP